MPEPTGEQPMPGSNDDLLRIFTRHGIADANDNDLYVRIVHLPPGARSELRDELVAWRNAACADLAARVRAAESELAGLRSRTKGEWGVRRRPAEDPIVHEGFSNASLKAIAADTPLGRVVYRTVYCGEWEDVDA